DGSRVTFQAVGDIMMSRGVNQAVEHFGNRMLPFSRMASDLDSADFNFGNLESPISGNDSRRGEGLVFNTRRRHADALARYKFRIVGLANNHALDQGVGGLRNTQRYLAARGIEYVGVGENKTQAWQPRIIAANGISIGFLAASYASVNDGGVSTNQYVARIEDREYLRAAISELKTHSDLVVVAMHAGDEYTR